MEQGHGDEIDYSEYDPFDRDDADNAHDYVFGSTGGGRSVMRAAVNTQYLLENRAILEPPSIEDLAEHIQADDGQVVLGTNQNDDVVFLPTTATLSANHDSTLFDFVAAQGLAAGRAVRVLGTNEWLAHCYGPSEQSRPEHYALFQHLAHASTDGDFIVINRPGRFGDAPPRDELSAYLPEGCLIMINTTQDQSVNLVYDGQGYYVANPPSGLVPENTGMVLPPA